MGIAGLVEHALGFFLNARQTIRSLVEKGNTTCVVDFSSWHHDVLYGPLCEALQCDDRDEAVRLATQYFGAKLNMLKEQGVTVVHFVRDGAPLGSKAGTDAERAAARAAAGKEAALLLAKLKKPQLRAAVRKDYHKCCVTAARRERWLEEALCDYLTARSSPSFLVTWEVALYEADAQIAHLLRIERYHFGICEDQDIAMYAGGKVRLVLKLGYGQWGYAANECDVLDSTMWEGALPGCGEAACKGFKCTACRTATGSCAYGLDPDSLLQACVLAGTDYWPGLNGIGLAKGCEKIREHGSMVAAITAWRLQKGTAFAPEQSETLAARAYYTFRHHWVRTPAEDDGATIAIVPINPYGNVVIEPAVAEQFLGTAPTKEIAHNISKGFCEPFPPYHSYASAAPAEEGAAAAAPSAEEEGGAAAAASTAEPDHVVAPNPVAVAAAAAAVALEEEKQAAAEHMRAVESALCDEPVMPSAATQREIFGLKTAVAPDKMLSAADLRSILKLRISDNVPGADVFCRKDDGSLRTPAEQLAEFQRLDAAGTLTKVGYLVPYATSRGLKASLRFSDLKRVVRRTIELEAKVRVPKPPSPSLALAKLVDDASLYSRAQNGAFSIIDSADGRYEKARQQRLVAAGVLRRANAPSVVPLRPPPPSDARWAYATTADFMYINAAAQMYLWHDIYYKSYVSNSFIVTTVVKSLISNIVAENTEKKLAYCAKESHRETWCKFTAGMQRRRQ